MAKKSAAKKADKPLKVPGIFKKSYPGKRFRKKISKWIYIKEYQDYIRQVFQEDKEGNFRIKQDLGKPDRKKLKIIAKSIKKNRGIIQAGKVILVVVILGLITGFNFLFKDALFESAAENWLEAIFEARADLTGLKFQPEKGRIFFKALAVADHEQPFKNLFELGLSEISLNTEELIKGKVIINNIECQEIRWNTDRQTSGALAARRTAESAGAEPGSGGTAAGTGDQSTGEEAAPAFSFDLDSIDTAAILESQKDNLATLQQVDEVKATITTLQEKWSGIAAVYQQDLEELAATVRSFTSLRVQDIKSVAEATRIYNQVEGAVSDVQQMGDKIIGTKEDFEADLAVINTQKDKITAAITADYENLKSFIQLPGQEKQSILAAVADEYLQENLGQFYTYGIKVVDYLKRLKAENKKTEAEAVPEEKQGRDVKFPARTYPKFLLRQAAFSIGDKQAADYFEMTVSNISSDPELTGLPVAFAVKNTEDHKEISLAGQVDSREQAEVPFELDFLAANYPLEIDQKLAFLGVENLKSTFRFATRFTLDRANQITGDVDLLIGEIQLQLAEATNIITRELTKILKSINEITVEAAYSITGGREFDIDASTNVDDIIKDRIGELIEETIRNAEEQIRNAFDAFIVDKLKENELLYNAFREVEAALDGNLTDVNGYKKLLEDKQKELKNLQGRLEQAIRDEADRLQREAEAAAKEAADKAAAEVDKATDNVTNQITNQADSLKNKFGF